MKKFALFLILILAVIPTSAEATHAWGHYHWARTANPFTLKLGDNVSANWDSSLAVASSDWSASSVLDTTIVAGQSNPKNCRATAGRVEVCNSRYGNNGWLGIASIWDRGDHITQGTVKLNDTYFNTATYNKPAWRQLVVCQEIAHTFGLDHQDENFNNANLGTCMDYTNNPDSNQHPNRHDFDELEIIYAHLDSTNTVLSAAPNNKLGASQVNLNDRSDWGKKIRTSTDGRTSLFHRHVDGQDVFTFVTWAE